jgi:peptidyl-prolyl cis-trans isomerase B (cyclophilin B)
MARAKMERQLARRAAKARRNRQLQAGLAVGLVVLVAVAVGLFVGGVFSSKPKPATTATCVWKTPADAGTRKDVGQPPTSGESRTGTETMTVATDQGTIAVSLDLAKAPCAGSSFRYLAGKNFFSNTTCHRLTTSGIFVLQCGDPKGDGSGGPAYAFADENLPSPALAPSATASAAASVAATASAKASATASASASAQPSASPAATVTYARGTVAMANSGPDSNGSQFFIVYKDSQMAPSYSVIGTVTSGLDVVDKVAAAGAVDANGAATGDGKPKTAVTVQSLTVGTEPSATIAPTPSGSASASPSAASNS